MDGNKDSSSSDLKTRDMYGLHHCLLNYLIWLQPWAEQVEKNKPRHASIMYKHPVITHTHTPQTMLQSSSAPFLRNMENTNAADFKARQDLGKRQRQDFWREQNPWAVHFVHAGPLCIILSPLPGWLLSCYPSVTEPDNHNNLFVLNLRSHSPGLWSDTNTVSTGTNYLHNTSYSLPQFVVL